MKLSAIFGFVASLFGVGCTPPDPTSPAALPNETAMRELRLMMLTTPASRSGIEPSEAYPKVFGVVMDIPISSGHTATVVSMCDGHASLYTTSTFGVLGGIDHESVRSAAMDFVKNAQSHFTDAEPTADYPYPASSHVKFYLLGFGGVRVIEVQISDLERGTDACSVLWELGQRVLTELRLTTEKENSAQ